MGNFSRVCVELTKSVIYWFHLRQSSGFVAVKLHVGQMSGKKDTKCTRELKIGYPERDSITPKRSGQVWVEEHHNTCKRYECLKLKAWFLSRRKTLWLDLFKSRSMHTKSLEITLKIHERDFTKRNSWKCLLLTPTCRNSALTKYIALNYCETGGAELRCNNTTSEGGVSGCGISSSATTQITKKITNKSSEITRVEELITHVDQYDPWVNMIRVQIEWADKILGVN